MVNPGRRPYSAARSCRSLLLLSLVVAFVPRARADGALSSAWEGSYDCAQGHTAVTLVLRSVGDEGALGGVFYFHASPNNPGIPEGCFAVGGRYHAGSREVKLSARQWLLQPFGYVTVDLDGQLAPGGDQLSGRVIGPLCTSFNLRRVAGPRAIPSPCLASEAVAWRWRPGAPARRPGRDLTGGRRASPARTSSRPYGPCGGKRRSSTGTAACPMDRAKASA